MIIHQAEALNIDVVPADGALDTLHKNASVNIVEANALSVNAAVNDVMVKVIHYDSFFYWHP